MPNIWQWTLLPSEIQYKIFGHLTFRERCRCSTVCRSWHSLIMKWPDMWKSLSTADGHTIIPELLQYKKYIDGSFVKHVNVRKTYDDTYKWDLQEVIKFLADQECNMIEHVEIQFQERANRDDEFNDTSSVAEEIPQTNAPAFNDLTSICGDALTRIKLNIDTRKAISTPDLLLKQCPKLEQLWYTVLSLGHMSWISRLKGVKHQHLVDLNIQITKLNISSHLMAILEAVPKLQRLGLLTNYNIGNDTPIASMVRQRCPDLVNLGFGAFQDLPRLNRWCGTAWKSRKSVQSGLEELAIYNEDECVPIGSQHILHQFLLESFATLKTLELANYVMFLQPSTLNSLSDLVFPSLTSLVLEHVCQRAQPWLLRFLEHSVPNLNSITLRYIEGGTEILHSLALGVKHLEHLELAHWPEYSSEDQIAQFFATVAETSPMLRSLTLVDMETATARILETVVTKYRAIDYLSVYEFPDLLIVEDIGQIFTTADFERKMESLNLTLGCVPPEDLYFSPEIFTKEGSAGSALMRLDSIAKRWKLSLKPIRRRYSEERVYPYPWSITDKEFRKQKDC